MSEYSKCATCKYWTNDGPSRGTCALFVVMPVGRGAVLCDADHYSPDVTLPLRTKADFGCVLHSSLSDSDTEGEG